MKENKEAAQKNKSSAHSADSSSKKGVPEKTMFAAFAVLTVLIFAGFVFLFVLKPTQTASPNGNAVLPSGTQPTGTITDTTNAAAIVGSQKILLSDLEMRYALVPEELKTQITKKTLLDSMVENAVLLQEAEKNNITVSEEELQLSITGQQAQAQQLIDQGLMTQAFFEKSVGEYLKVNKFLEEKVFSTLTVSEEKITEFFEQNKDSMLQVQASHILVATEADAESVLAEITAGGNFSEIAKAKSTDTGSAANGGDLGFFTKAEVVPEFGEAAFSMSVGDAPKIVESEFGFHIIKVTAKKEMIADFRDQIEQFLLQDEKTAAYTALIAKLKQEKNVQVLYTEAAAVQAAQ